MQKFTHGKSARAAHQALLASVRTMEKAKQHAVLWFADIQKRKLYRRLGYASMNMYATQALGFSSSRASDFARLAGKLDELPQLRGALEDGEIGYTKAAHVARVSNKENEGAWLEEARRSTRRQLEGKIKAAKKKAADLKKGQPTLLMPAAEVPEVVLPVRVTTEFTPEQFARYEALLEKINKGGRRLPADRAEALLELLAAHASAEENSPRRESSSFQIHLHRCPDCERTTVQTSRGELPVAPATAERADCDAQVVAPGARNKATIPPRTRRHVLARDRHRCTRPGCNNTHYLEVHHLIPRAQGGGNEPENLITLCAACHQLLHEKKWAPADLVRERPTAYGRIGETTPRPRSRCTRCPAAPGAGRCR